jgi:endonuclease-8
MPEGPSMLIASEEMSAAAGKKVLKVSGNSREPIARLKGQTLKEIGTWGKHLLLFFTNDVIKIHFLMFGSYAINTPKEGRDPRLMLGLSGIKIYFYSCALRFLEENVEDTYDWSGDILSPSWDEQKAFEKIKKQPREMVCDVLMDQDIFGGVGNIIKNEVQFNMRLRPQVKVGKLSQARQLSLIREAHDYAWKFYVWKKNFELKKHWQVMRRKFCAVCGGPVTKEVTGRRKRISHYCKRCQKLS